MHSCMHHKHRSIGSSRESRDTLHHHHKHMDPFLCCHGKGPRSKPIGRHDTACLHKLRQNSLRASQPASHHSGIDTHLDYSGAPLLSVRHITMDRPWRRQQQLQLQQKLHYGCCHSVETIPTPWILTTTFHTWQNAHHHRETNRGQSTSSGAAPILEYGTHSTVQHEWFRRQRRRRPHRSSYQHQCVSYADEGVWYSYYRRYQHPMDP